MKTLLIVYSGPDARVIEQLLDEHQTGATPRSARRAAPDRPADARALAPGPEQARCS